MHSMITLVDTTISTWIGYIKALKLSLDDRLLICRDMVVGINQEASKLQVIQIPEDSGMEFSTEYRNVVGYMNQTEPHVKFDIQGSDHDAAIICLIKYIKLDYESDTLWYTEDFCEMYPSTAKMVTDAGYEVIQLPPGFGIVMIPGLFSKAKKDKVRLDVKDLKNGMALVKFSHYKDSIKATIDIYTSQMLIR